jgi:AbrB family looped-hinge helix DNA binding protein
MADTATLSSKFQISIPKAVREHQCWEAGQKLVFVPKGRGVLIVPAPSRESLRGVARGADPEGYRDRDDRV